MGSVIGMNFGEKGGEVKAKGFFFFSPFWFLLELVNVYRHLVTDLRLRPRKTA